MPLRWVFGFRLLLSAICLPLSASYSWSRSGEIAVQNQVLVQVQDRKISVMDVMKRMDLFLNRHYPQHASSAPIRLDYYRNQWREVLQQMIEDTLMVADATSRGVKVSDGEVREEMHLRFGTHMWSTLESIGLSYDEARALIQEEMIVQRMQWFRVTSKALQKVTSQEILKAYRDYLQFHPAKEEFRYQFLTIRGSNGIAVAEQIHSLQEEVGGNLEAAVALFHTRHPIESATAVTVSQELVVEKRILAESHKNILESLSIGAWGAPIEQVSKDGSSVIRMFHLKDLHVTAPPSFESLFPQLKQHLLTMAVQEENATYRKQLRKRFGFDPIPLDISAEFTPFFIR